MQADDDAVDALRRVHRAASDRLDDGPDPRVRAAVLAAAARGVAAGPRAASTTPLRRGPGRWPWSAAALLVVSVTTGLVATHLWRDRPESATTIASVTPSSAAPDRGPAPATAPYGPVASVARPAPETTAPAPTPSRPVAPRHHDRHADTQAKGEQAGASEPIEDMSLPAPPQASSALVTTPTQPDGAEAEASRNAAAAAAATDRATTALRARIGRIAEPQTPEAWIERIAQLRRDGRDVEADRELDALRRRYPDFVVPAVVRPASGTR